MEIYTNITILKRKHDFIQLSVTQMRYIIFLATD